MKDYIMKDISKFNWVLMADPGTTTVFATLFIAIHPYTKHIYILDEIYETDRNLTSTNVMWTEMIEKARDLHPGSSLESFEDWIKGYDQAAAWFASEMIYNHGVSFIPTDKANNKKENGISLIKDIFLKNLITISDRCQNTIKEISRYHTNERGEFIKKNDHTIDIIRYMLGMMFYDINDAIPNSHLPDNSVSRRRFVAHNPQSELEDIFKKFSE